MEAPNEKGHQLLRLWTMEVHYKSPTKLQNIMAAYADTGGNLYKSIIFHVYLYLLIRTYYLF